MTSDHECFETGPHWLFSSPGIYCLLQTLGAVTDGACSGSCVAGALGLITEVAYGLLQRWLALA